MSDTIEGHAEPTNALLESWFEMVGRLHRAPELAGDGGPARLVQTHISVVLLGPELVLKLKKPLDFGFLDYTTLEKRQHACLAEVELNSRLCPQVYLGVRTITETAGELQLGGEGRIVDYAVAKKLLPENRMLDRLIADGTVTASMLDKVAARLSDFHRSARRGAQVERYGSVETIRQNWQQNFDQAAPYIDRTIGASQFDAIRDWVVAWLELNIGLLQRRVAAGRICEGHGDVRCESVCLTGGNADDGVVIFDCIEFNERFRCIDVASEIAFLAMDLDARGRPDLGYQFTEQYSARSQDDELFGLLLFYRCLRAFIRGKVLSFQLDEPEFSEAEREIAAIRARHYFELAGRYASPLKAPTVIAVAGLSGSGKTSVAQGIAGELGLRVVSTDAVRHSIFGEHKKPSRYNAGSYDAAATQLTYRTMLEQGLARLQEAGGVVLDATFRRAADRQSARDLALAAGASFRLIECQLAPQQTKSRLETRAKQGDSLSDATWQTYLRQREEYEPPEDSPGETHLTLDTGEALVTCTRAATDWLRLCEEPRR